MQTSLSADNFPALLERFSHWLRRNDFDYPYSVRSIDTYLKTIGQFFNYCHDMTDLSEINTAVLRHFIKVKADGSPYAANSRQIRIAALNLFFVWAKDNGVLAHNPVSDYQETERTRRTLGGRGGRKPVRLPPVLSLAELERLNDCIMPGDSFNQVRDAFLITFILMTGIRTEEVTRIKLEQLHMAQQSCRVVGKGNKERLIKFKDTSLCAHTYPAYLIQREAQLAKLGKSSPALFITNRGTALSPRLVYQQVSYYLKKAQVQTERIGAHTLRHTAASLLLHQNVPITFIQQNFGHEDLKTTIRYLHLIRST